MTLPPAVMAATRGTNRINPAALAFLDEIFAEIQSRIDHWECSPQSMTLEELEDKLSDLRVEARNKAAKLEEAGSGESDRQTCLESMRSSMAGDAAEANWRMR